MSYLETPIIYNLFPRLAGTFDRWGPHLERAAGLGFNWIYLNPIHYTGFSGSLYAVKDHARLDPVIVPGGDDNAPLDAIRPALDQMKALGLHPIVDLVINHTSKDADLVREHPDWYERDAKGRPRSPYAIDPDTHAKTEWGDLAEIDNAQSPDRQALWDHWRGIVLRYLDVGFEGFRCDAAYKVPAELWKYLLAAAAGRDPNARFFAETLGCSREQKQALIDSGLHFFFNSVKWWDFRAEWALEQHEEFGEVPSIAFPETHDTERVASESGGNEAVSRRGYALAAMWSAGLMMPIGYEFGFRMKPDVVLTRPHHWEEPSFDLQPFVARVNALKRDLPCLHGEGHLELLSEEDATVVVLRRTTEAAPGQVCWIAINTDERAERELRRGALGGRQAARALRPCVDDAPVDGEPLVERLRLRPAEVALVLGGT